MDFEQGRKEQAAASLKASIFSSMQLRTTEELEEIWQFNDRTEWTDEAFDAVRKILLARTHALPEQDEPVTSRAEESSVGVGVVELLLGNRRLVLVALFLVLAYAATILYIQSRTLTNLVSLDSVWGRLETSARAWQSDAYLAEVNYTQRGGSAFELEARYASPQAPAKLLVLKMERSPTIAVSILDAPSYPAAPKYTIHRGDWTIDAQEALNIFAQEKAVEECLLSPGGADIKLSLNRFFSRDTAWELSIINCRGNEFFRYIDAKTGGPAAPPFDFGP